MRGQLAQLPPPQAEYWEWQRFAACRGTGHAVFFGAEGEQPSSRDQREREAKQVCARCPVQAQCLEHALTVAEPYGVWGGLTTSERRSYRNPVATPRTS